MCEQRLEGCQRPSHRKYGNAEFSEVGSSEVKDYERGEPMVVVEQFSCKVHTRYGAAVGTDGDQALLLVQYFVRRASI